MDLRCNKGAPPRPGIVDSFDVNIPDVVSSIPRILIAYQFPLRLRQELISRILPYLPSSSMGLFCYSRHVRLLPRIVQFSPSLSLLAPYMEFSRLLAILTHLCKLQTRCVFLMALIQTLMGHHTTSSHYSDAQGFAWGI